MHLPDLHLRAIRFAATAHYGQRVSGMPANYLYHLSCVASEVNNAFLIQGDFNYDLAIQVAWLHDVVEDTKYTDKEISNTFGDEVSRSVIALTKDDALPKVEQLSDSVDRILTVEREAAIVKLADRISNLQPPPSFWSEKKIKRYMSDSFMILERLGHSHDYLRKRLSSKIENYRQYL